MQWNHSWFSSGASDDPSQWHIHRIANIAHKLICMRKLFSTSVGRCWKRCANGTGPVSILALSFVPFGIRPAEGGDGENAYECEKCRYFGPFFYLFTLLLRHAYLIFIWLRIVDSVTSNNWIAEREDKNAETRDSNLRNRFADNFHCSGLCRCTRWNRDAPKCEGKIRARTDENKVRSHQVWKVNVPSECGANERARRAHNSDHNYKMNRCQQMNYFVWRPSDVALIFTFLCTDNCCRKLSLCAACGAKWNEFIWPLNVYHAVAGKRPTPTQVLLWNRIFMRGVCGANPIHFNRSRRTWNR